MQSGRRQKWVSQYRNYYRRNILRIFTFWRGQRDCTVRSRGSQLWRHRMHFTGQKGRNWYFHQGTLLQRNQIVLKKHSGREVSRNQREWWSKENDIWRKYRRKYWSFLISMRCPLSQCHFQHHGWKWWARLILLCWTGPYAGCGSIPVIWHFRCRIFHIKSRRSSGSCKRWRLRWVSRHFYMIL